MFRTVRSGTISGWVTSNRVTSNRATSNQSAICQRRRFGAVLLAVTMAVTATGCGRTSDDPPDLVATSPDTSPDAVGFGDAGPAEVSDPTGPAGPVNQPDPPPAGPYYPDTAQAYAEAILAAWHGVDLDRLAELTTPLVHDQLVQIPGPPAADWTRIQCDGGDCMFYNGDGDYLLLHVQIPRFGKPHAASHVMFDPVTYPQHHLDYLKQFVTAWQRGNLARMHALALPEVVEVYRQVSPGQVTNYGAVGGGGGLTVVVVTTVGAEIETHIGTTLLGGPQAIRKAIPEA